MENSSQQDGQQDLRVISGSTSSAGDRPVVLNNLMEQPLSPKDERIVSANPSHVATFTGPSRNTSDKPETSNTSGAHTPVHPLNSYSLQEQSLYYEGFDNSSGNWGDYSNYVNANSLQVVPPAMYNDNLPVLFHSGYGFDAQVAYEQFSPMASRLSPVMLDGQLYSPYQMPVSPSYFPHTVSPSMSPINSTLPISQMEQMTPGSSGEEGPSDKLFGPGSGYYLQFGSPGGGSLSGNNTFGIYKFPGDFGFAEPLPNQSNPLDTGSYLSPMTSTTVYPQPAGILGSYEHNIAQWQVSRQQTPFHGFGFASSPSTKHYPYGGSYHSSNFGSRFISPWEANRLNRLTPDRGGRRERDRVSDSNSVSTNLHGISCDRNRGPRSSKPKSRNTTEENSSPSAGKCDGVGKHDASASGIHLYPYNHIDFVTSYENAKFFIIKSFSEDNVHKSIKYNIWSSTSLGNRKLDAAYHEAKEMKNYCPVFLFFSVNASGQFCGVAEMVGPVDFENDVDYWQQDRWSGQFPVRWHIIKDVPNSRLRYILLENNDKKPVTHSRDSQEVKVDQGIEMLKIFKNYDADTSIIDDFTFYDEREKAAQEKHGRQQASPTKNSSSALVDDSINQLSDNLTEALQLEESK